MVLTQSRSDQSQGPAPIRRQIVLPRARIVERIDITKDLWVIKLLPEKPFAFKPGQYCTIGVDGIERAYSIASAPHEPFIELFIELVSEGELTPRLHELQVGAEVTMRPSAKGVFTFNPKYSQHLMVATVTGVVPFVSMMRDYLNRRNSGHFFHILEGASYADEFTYDTELNALAMKHPGILTCLTTVSRPEAERNHYWEGACGRVNLIVEDYVASNSIGIEDTLVYLCGHPGMIEDLKERLIPRGFKVVEERFWKE